MSRVAPEADEARLIEADGVERALAGLSLAMPPVAPPQGLWAKIAAEIGPTGAASEERGWRRLAPGVEIKLLTGARSFLVRCEAGATVPRHRHRSFEHSLILSGDVATEAGDFQAGDLLGAPVGWHEPWGTRGGCLVLLQYDA